MPLIKVQTSVSAPTNDTVEGFLKQLSASLAKHLSKPEAYVMTAFEANTPMTFGGTSDPTCYVEIKSIGLMPEQIQVMSRDICSQIQDALGVPPNRTYIEFTPSPGDRWGWNSKTFR